MFAAAASAFPNHVDHGRTSFYHVKEPSSTLTRTQTMMNERDAKFILIQLYWLLLNGLATEQSTFSLEQAPFNPSGQDARFRVNYSLSSPNGGTYRVGLMTRFVLVIVGGVGQDIYDESTVIQQMRATSRHTNTMCLKQYNISTEDALRLHQLFISLSQRVADQFGMPIKQLTYSFQTLCGVGHWINLCDALGVCRVNTLTGTGLEYLESHNVALTPFSIRTYLQWDNTVPPKRRFIDADEEEEDANSPTNKKRKRDHFATYEPEAKRVFKSCYNNDDPTVIVMPSTIPHSGLGIFAARDIEAGEEITQYHGIVNVASTESPKAGQFTDTHKFALTYGNANTTIDGIRFPAPHCGVASLINSACRSEANAKFSIRHRRLLRWAVVIATRAISKGEEILINYPYV
jgi:hypothetical protein